MFAKRLRPNALNSLMAGQKVRGISCESSVARISSCS